MKEAFKVDVALNIKTGVCVNLELPDMTYEKWIDMTPEEQKRYIEDYLDFDDGSIYEEICDSAFDLDIEYDVEEIN